MAADRASRTPRTGRLARALLVATATLVTAGACKPLDDVMVAVFDRSMRDSRSFDPYENTRLPGSNSVPFASGNYPAADGQVNTGQPEMGPYMPPMTKADMTQPGADFVRNLSNPIPATEESLARGELMYGRYCAVCHGASGTSAEAPIVEKHGLMLAYDLATGAAVDFPDGYIYGMIRVGRGQMPGYGDRITHFDRWHIVNYVRTLQGAAPGEAGEAGEGG